MNTTIAVIAIVAALGLLGVVVVTVAVTIYYSKQKLLNLQVGAVNLHQGATLQKHDVYTEPQTGNK